MPEKYTICSLVQLSINCILNKVMKSKSYVYGFEIV